jgi:hypothetical protein
MHQNTVASNRNELTNGRYGNQALIASIVRLDCRMVGEAFIQKFVRKPCLV